MKLKEKQLQQIIKESLKKTLNEIDFDANKNAIEKKVGRLF